MTEERIILGIDPGTTVMGYGLILVDQQPRLIQLGVVKLHKYKDHHKKLQVIFERTSAIIKTWNPSICAVEAPFFGKNVQSMLKLGRAQGTAIAAAMNEGLEVAEYAPKKIKMAITGNGNASKEQVAAMLKHILKADFAEDVATLDATDGVAAAVCHYFQSKNGQPAGKSFSSWAAFAKANPKRVR